MNPQTATGAGQTGSLLEDVYNQDHVLITAALELVNGRFLQPTGFPDIGACIYRDKDGRRWCLVESEQSMANRLEAVCMRDPGVWIDELKGLPVIAVRTPDGDLLTTNLCEPHRCASSYVLEAAINGGRTMKQLFESKLGLRQGGDSWPLDKRAELDKLVFALDPGALLHGFQFIQWKFVGLRQTRLLHARLEAELAEEPEVHYGMVKWDAIEPESARQERANKGQSIAAKSRIVPNALSASFEIDVLSLKGLALDDRQKKFLLSLALWKIGAFLANKKAFDARSRQTLPSLRLRADCYLRCSSISWKGSAGEVPMTTGDLMGALQNPPAFRELLSEVLEGVHSGNDNALPYEGPVVNVTYKLKHKKEKSPPVVATEAGSPEDSNEEADSEE
ncbi:MAG TPA: type I-U CRISPR-associated RAMP protein Csb1/Cas7u [Bryobacteraceae bacterium]|nr:type I-U CRISPR-associated RAMP protein Csb1/Cas7u [Bryobacteraceae bacterium]